MNDWEINLNNLVYPTILAPVSYSAFRSMNECLLRFVFNHNNQSIVSKINPNARMGIAFHETLSFLSTQKVTLDESIEYFENAVKKQRIQSLQNYREKRLRWSKELREKMENIIALKVAQTTCRDKINVKHSVEKPLLSPDGSLIGRPDEIFINDSSVTIVDYKTGRCNPETIEIAEAQILFYSGIWEEIKGSFPASGRIEFIIDNYSHQVKIDREKAKNILINARKFLNAFDNSQLEFKSNLGKHCYNCEFRPWCEDYWNHSDITKTPKSNDIDGYVCNDHPRDSLTFCLIHRGAHFTIVNRDLDPIPDLKPGIYVRAIDLLGEGSIRHRVEWSEVFFLKNSHV
jgi:CRISPR/Cas system-associated exonuclease Cas4 (RecB family)